MSTQLAFATSATAFNLSRSAERSRRAHLAVLAALAVVVCGATGCSHVVHIDSAPGAEILVNGQSIGRSPATYTETTGAQGSVQVTARLKGREKTVTVERSEIDAAPIGAGAAVGAGACGAGLVVTLVTVLIVPPCGALLGIASWAAFAAGPLAGWMAFSHRMPDAVHVDLADASQAVATGDEAYGEDQDAVVPEEGETETKVAKRGAYVLPEADAQPRASEAEVRSDRAGAEQGRAKRRGAIRRKRTGTAHGQANY